jgi:hypothetical protein
MWLVPDALDSEAPLRTPRNAMGRSEKWDQPAGTSESQVPHALTV